MKSLACAVVALFLVAIPSNAQVLTENFDVVAAGIPTSTPGWVNVNHSDSPDQTYFQGNATVFPSHLGAPNAYIGCNFQSTSGPVGNETISNWLLTPIIGGIQNGMTFSFFTRTTTANPFPDRLQVRLNTTNTGTNVGVTPLDVGDFTTLMLDINPTYQTGPANYPEVFTNFTLTVSGVPSAVSGRFAFRYFVENAGPNGANSNYIGIDTLTINAVPEPGSMALMGIGALAFGVGRKLRRAKS